MGVRLRSPFLKRTMTMSKVLVSQGSHTPFAKWSDLASSGKAKVSKSKHVVS